MRIVVSIFTILFGLLHIIAAVTQFRAKAPAARGSATIMICGGIAVVCASAAHLAGGIATTCMEAAVGFLLIGFAAYLNGKQAGKTNLLHHVIRGTIAVLLIVGFIIW